MLDLCYNQFSGRIPAGLGNCSALKVLKAGHNRLTGTLPDEIFNASSLEHLSFPNNGLLGILDGARILNLRNVAILDLGGNRLNGKIPDTIGKLKRLEELHLDDNDTFEGLPSSPSNCTNLRTIDLKRNSFSGNLTEINFSTLINLQKLDLLHNNFTGTIPQSIYSCSNLNALRLSVNKLHGQLSLTMANLKSLIFLSLSGNNFTNITNMLQVLKNCKNLTVLVVGGGNSYKGDTMPEDETIDGFQNLQVLSISGSLLSGKIPLWLSKFKNLRMLFLNTNQLSGPIPAWIKSLKSLFYLDIANNNLTGEIPTALMEMPMLRITSRAFGLSLYQGSSLEYRITSAFPRGLNLGNNNFTGVIPPEIGQLKSLDTLYLSSNSLSGEIPRQLCSLMNLQVLELSNNRLTGAIPSDLNKLHFLSAFNISNNDFEGPIPTGGQFSTFTSSSFGGNPKLCGAIVGRPCGSAKTPLVSSLYAEQKDISFGFAIAFGAFFGVGVLYDQIVFSKYFG
jgi:Leucine-rich repeat (LRR) protein